VRASCPSSQAMLPLAPGGNRHCKLHDTIHPLAPSGCWLLICRVCHCILHSQPFPLILPGPGSTIPTAQGPGMKWVPLDATSIGPSDQRLTDHCRTPFPFVLNRTRSSHQLSIWNGKPTLVWAPYEKKQNEWLCAYVDDCGPTFEPGRDSLGPRVEPVPPG